MQVLTNIGKLAQCKPSGSQADIHCIEDAALVWNAAKIEWVGPQAELPTMYRSAKNFNARGAFVIPGLIDCHTHLAFGGDRADEFEMRSLGKDYLEIAKAGGGILSTVTATRAATHDELYSRSKGYLGEIAKLGVTTIECKSGYGLTFEDEIKLLEVYKQLSEQESLGIVSTFLGAHIVPAEYGQEREKYVELLVERMIPEIAKKKLAKFCDVFVEDSAFTVQEARRILEAGNAHGLRAKLHADQLTAGGGAELAASLAAISADHLEQVSHSGIEQMANADVVAVTLPIASLYTRQPPLNARPLIETGVSVAVATDFNPGSAPSYHLPFAMMLACTLNRMSPAEALKGSTIQAAKALGMQNEIGSLEPGKAADFALIDSPDINQWLYLFKPNSCIATVRNGEMIYDAL